MGGYPDLTSSLIVFIFGAVIGSFLNVCIARIPKQQSIISPPSHCPLCETPIRSYDNIPLISYLFLRGRCRSCGGAISPRYFIVELLMASLAVILFYRFGFDPAFFIYLIFVAGMIVIAFIDLDARIVPDAISLPGIGLGLAAAVVNRQWSLNSWSAVPSPFNSFIGILVGGGILLAVAWIYQLFTGKEGMGGGDIKLLAMIGAFLGWSAVLLTLFFASLSGSVVGLALMFAKGVDSKYALPFAPFLCLGALLALFFGRELILFYLPSG